MPPTLSAAADARRDPLSHRLLGRLFAGFVRAVRLCPERLAYAMADLLVPVLVTVTWLGRSRADRKKRGFYRNVRIAFGGELPGRQRRRLLWSWARHMCWFGVDVCRMPCLDLRRIAERVDTTELDALAAERTEGQGMIWCSGHIGIYELCGHVPALLGWDIVAIFKESPIPPLTDVINALRGGSGQHLIERGGALRGALRALREGCAVGVIADVSAKDSRVFAPFLGTDAATNGSVGALHLRSGAPVAVIGMHREGRQRFRFKVWDIIRVTPGADRDADLHTVACRINEAMSRAIHAYPEQWFWDSRRFRTRPADERRGADDLPPMSLPSQAMRPEMLD